MADPGTAGGAGVQQLPPDPSRALIDRLGGAVVLWTAVALLAVIALVDGLGLPTLMALREPSLRFVDACSEAAGWGGGFAILLLLATSLIVAGLFLLAPRSLWVGLGFFVVVLGLQIFVANKGGLTNVLKTQLLVGLYDFELTCSTGSGNLYLHERVQQAYNPGKARSPGGDVPLEFTDMLAANLGLMALCACVLLALGGGRTLFAKLRPPPVNPGGTATEPLDFLKGPERTILVQSTLLLLAILMIGPTALLYADKPDDASKPVIDLLWAGPFVLLVDMARLMLVSARTTWPEAADAPREEAAGPPELILESLSQRLRQEFKTRVSNAIEVPPATGQIGIDRHSPQEAPRPGQGRYLLGTLKAENYNEILTCLNQGVLDRGRTALVICPGNALDHFSREILDRLGSERTRLQPRSWTANPQLSEDAGPLEIIFASPELLSEVLDKLAKIQSEIATLGGIFVIGLHRMDVGLLGLGLRRLKPFVENPKEMIALVQSERRGNVGNYVRQLPLLNELPDQSDRATPDLDRRGPGLALILRDPGESAFDRQANWPIWVNALLAARRIDSRAEIYVFDTEADFPTALWRDRVIEVLRGDAAPELIEWARELQRTVLFPVDAPHPTAVIEDNGNLADALRIGIADTQAIESLRVIVTRDYPGASFLRAKLDNELQSVNDKSQIKAALAHFCDTHGSFFPKPQGGPIELALLVLQEYTTALRQGKKLRQDALDRLWADRKVPIEHLGISNTRVGLERLFRQTFPIASTASFVTRQESGDRRWTYNLAEQSLTTSDTLATFALQLSQQTELPREGENPPDPVKFDLPAADHGLSYAERVRMVVAGEIYMVQTVQPDRRAILVRADNGRPVRPYAFVREYAIQLDQGPAEVSFAAEDRSPIQDTRRPFEIASGYAHIARRTTAHLEHGSSRAPMGPEGVRPTRTETAVETGFRLRTVGLLRTYQEASASTARGGAAPARRRMRGRGRSAAARPQERLAFTLATTLQDVLGLMFRPFAHRIAVLTTERLVMPPVGRSWDPVTAYCLERQPAFGRGTASRAFATTDRELATRHRLGRELQDAYGEFFNRFIAQARAGHDVPPATETPHISLFIVEDSDHDLGIVRFLNDDPGKVLGFWADYLDHYAEVWESKGAHDYAYGADRRPECYDFAAAAAYVSDMQ